MARTAAGGGGIPRESRGFGRRLRLEAPQIGGGPCTRSLQFQGILTLKLTCLRAFLSG